MTILCAHTIINRHTHVHSFLLGGKPSVFCNVHKKKTLLNAKVRRKSLGDEHVMLTPSTNCEKIKNYWRGWMGKDACAAQERENLKEHVTLDIRFALLK